MEISLIFSLCFQLLCRRGNNHFDVHFRRIRPVFFPSKGGKDAVREVIKGQKGVYFRQKSAFFFYIYYDSRTFRFLNLDLACKQLYFPPRKGINWRNKSTDFIIKTVAFLYCTVLYKKSF